MSWQLGAFTLLGLALVAGFAWYERQRPDARIVALVGTLAAFAALGRIAFAALPNVKPTTDIVLISGYALGGGPGFAVGALAGLTSNFFFGQGPWTPWQMAAWGATGVLGAGLARLATLRPGGPSGAHPNPGQEPIGRWPLAIVCCLAGFAFTVIQDVGDWVNYSDHSLAQLGVYVGQGLGFDAIHAAGCFAFAFVFGPALTRSIQRFARRLQVTWVSPGTAAASSIAVALVLCGALGLRQPPPARAAGGLQASISYLVSAENSDGGFGPAPGQPSAALYSGWAALGLASAGTDLRRVTRNGGGLLAYVRGAPGSLSDVGSLERTILLVRAAGLPARSFGGRDLLASLERHVRSGGSVAGQVNLTAFAVLALRSAGVAPPAATIAWLERQQDGDGGFNFVGAGATSDVDDTGAVLEALAGRSGGAGQVRSRAIAYLRRQQNRDGGFASQPGGESNSQSTAWAIQGLDAVHIDPASWHHGGPASPLSFLRSMIANDGSVRYARGVQQTPVWVTAQALMALEGKPLPLAPVAGTPAPAAPAAPVAAAPAATPAAPAVSSGRPATPRGRRPATTSGPHRAAGTSPHPSNPAHGVRGGRSAHALRASPVTDLVTAAGLATALALAPLGLG